jgi:hypothetical protein
MENDDDARATSENKPLDTAVNKHQLLFSTFFWDRPGTPKVPQKSHATTAGTTNIDKNNDNNKNKQEVASSSSSSDSTQGSNSNALDGILDYVDQHLIPRDPPVLRQTTLYQNSLRQLEYQRDQYMVGHEYAEWRRKEKQKLQHQTTTATTTRSRIRKRTSHSDIPYDATALGHQHLAPLAAQFIPTERVQTALAPILASVPNLVYVPTRNATVNIILGQFHNLSNLMKMQVLTFLDNPKNRSAMKASTQGMILKNTPQNTASSTNSETFPNTVPAPPTETAGS